jgi:hypothetical protein
MTDELFALLGSKGITSGPAAFEAIDAYTYEEMMDLAAGCFLAIKNIEKLPESKLFSFAPIKSIAGGPYPCTSVECRLDAAYSFSLIASLYAEKVILPNFFDYMFYILEQERQPPQSEQEILDFEYNLCSDIAVCYLYKPLFEAGIAAMNFTIPTVCKHCHARHTKESSEFNIKLDKALKLTEPVLKSKVKFVYQENNYIEVVNEDNYLGGELGYAIRHTLKAAMRKHKSQIPYQLSENEISRFGLRDHQIDLCVDDILEYDFYPSLNASTYLTNRQFDVDLIEAAKANNEDALMTHHIPAFHEVPFLQDILIEDVIKLRQKEESSFKAYRNVVAKIVNSRDATEAAKYAKVELIPALDNISNIITQNQKHYRALTGKKITKRTIVAAAGIGAANLLNIPIQASISALGVAGLFSVQDILDDLKAGKDIPIDAKVDPYYFLWGIKQKHDAGQGHR